MYEIDIQKALSLPTCRRKLKSIIGDKMYYCAWGGAFVAIDRTCFSSDHMLKGEYQKLWNKAHIVGIRKNINPMSINDDSTTEEERQLARRLAVQLLLETGEVVPMAKDLELAKEIQKVAI